MPTSLSAPKGSAVGEAIDPAGGGAAFNGVAYKAKLWFQDIGLAGEDTLSVPSDLNNLFAEPYAGGARIHSNSWGSDSNEYTMVR